MKNTTQSSRHRTCLTLLVSISDGSVEHRPEQRSLLSVFALDLLAVCQCLRVHRFCFEVGEPVADRYPIGIDLLLTEQDEHLTFIMGIPFITLIIHSMSV